MFSKLTSRTLSSVVRTPAIRFRYGASKGQQTVTAAAPPAKAHSGAPSSAGQVIHDFELPQRWRRRPISEEEIAYINRGGPA